MDAELIKFVPSGEFVVMCSANFIHTSTAVDFGEKSGLFPA